MGGWVLSARGGRRSRQARRRAQRGVQACYYLYNGADEAGNVCELCHVDGKVLELVLLGLVEDEARAVTDGIDAAQVGGGVEGWVGGPGQRDVWKAGRAGAVGGGGAWGAQRGIARVCLAAAGGDGGL
jgi:hypothetical protein